MPVKNEICTIEITAYGAGGEGIGKIDGYTVFVPFACVGETCEIQILKAGKSYGYGKLLKVIAPSAARVEPPCAHYKKCGGCSIMHLAASEQAALKRQRVLDTLTHIAGTMDPCVKETVQCNSWFYRNKVMVPVEQNGQEPLCGFYAPRSHRVIPFETCQIQHPINTAILQTVLDWMKQFHIKGYQSETHTGIVRTIYTRIGKKTKEVMVSLIVNTKKLPHTDELVAALRALPLDGYNLVAIVENTNTKPGNTLLGSASKTLYGRDYIYDFLGDVEYKISHNAFFQINPEVAERLYSQAVRYCGLTKQETVFDLYCGTGTISLFLAKQAKQVIGVEYVEAAVCDAKENAARNKIENVTFLAGKAEEIVPDLYKQGTRADVVVVDPPRKGCDAALLETMAAMGPKRIVYVSCDPATLARDVKFLTQNGYALQEAIPFDMFPQTAHVETVVLLTKN